MRVTIPRFDCEKSPSIDGPTPHRYTGVYRFEDATLRNVHLYDKYEPKVMRGEDAPMAATYCALLKSGGSLIRHLEILDASADPRAQKVARLTPVVSYCGVLIRLPAGGLYGTLCNFDMARCQSRSADVSLMEYAAMLLYDYIHKY